MGVSTLYRFIVNIAAEIITLHVSRDCDGGMYLPPPQVASGRFSYADAYSNVIAAHRRSPLSSASSIVILAAPDVDALCAARMLADLLRQDDVIFRIRPVSGLDELERVKDELRLITEVRLY